MVYGELGRYPLRISIAKRIIAYWHKLEVRDFPMKLSRFILNYVKLEYTDDLSRNIMLSNVHSVLNKCGIMYVLQNPAQYDTK